MVNSSRTLPGGVAGRPRDGAAQVQLRPGALREGEWDALAVETGAAAPQRPAPAGEILRAPGGLRLRVLAPRGDAPLLWRMTVESGDPIQTLLRDGEPIRYSYVPDPVPLEHYQTVYAGTPGSVETPSAGRHLTWELLGELRRARHRRRPTSCCTAGSAHSRTTTSTCRSRSSRSASKSVRTPRTASTARRRVIAVGTSVIRTLETAVDDDGDVHPMRGWTRLVITPRTRLRVVDALLTGLHEPPATHLDMLGALLDTDLLERAYVEVRERGYLWHEFGDAMLIV